MADGQKQPITSQSECIVCRSTIHSEAKKCVQCDSFQNWRRHIGVSATTLALLIALFTVLFSSIGTIWDTISTKNSDLFINFVSFRDGKAIVAATNFGKRPGLLMDGFLLFEDKNRGIEGASENSTFVRTFINAKYATKVDHGETVVVQYEIDAPLMTAAEYGKFNFFYDDGTGK